MKPLGLNYFGEVLYELMRRPPRYINGASELARAMREAGYANMRQQYVDRYMKLNGHKVPTWFCAAVTNTLDLDLIEQVELAWAMAYGQDVTLANLERTEEYRRHRRLWRSLREASGFAGFGDRRV